MGLERDDHVMLTKEERKLIKREMKDTTPTRMLRCNILLQADENVSSNKKKKFTLEAIADRSGTSVNTVRTTIHNYLEGGLVATLSIARNPETDNAHRKVTEEMEVKIVETMLSDPPDGYCRWTVSLLHNVIAEEYDIGRTAVGEIVKKHDLRPYLKESWCIPPENDPEYVYHMEDVLEVYRGKYTKLHPAYCVDEKPFQLLGEGREPIPMKEGSPEKIDSTYVRCGTVSVSVVYDIMTGYIHQKVKETRTAVDFAETLKWISDKLAPEAEKIVLVMDNLNTHTLASLYKAFKPEEALRLARRFEVHYTPVHASWLDMAEIAINVMTRQCLGKRIPGIKALREKLDSWESVHNKVAKPFRWTFTVNDARVKLVKVYPDIDEYLKERDKLREAKQEAMKKHDSDSNEDTQDAHETKGEKKRN